MLGANAATYDAQRLPGPYRHLDTFHEPFVLFGYLAGVTETVGFCTSIMISPQRQTALLAKQAAEVDLLCGGRLRLGLGTGWNYVEYEALGVPFSERGARQVEQITLLRELWTKPLVTFEGRFHKISDSGIYPLPHQRPIPIWLGGLAEPVLKRIGALADGWMPSFQSLNQHNLNLGPAGEDPRAVVERVHAYARAAGRDPAKLGMQGRVTYMSGGPDDWADLAGRWGELGATHLAFNTMNAGLDGVDAHIEALRRFRDAVMRGAG